MATLAMLLTAGCGGREGAARAAATEPPKAQTAVPPFCADSAFAYVERQLAFGARVPGTRGHAECGDYLEQFLRSAGADSVIEQSTTLTAFNGDRLPVRNIMARYGSDATERILLLAHWDTRPWADAEADFSLHSKPVPGANDGASGVAVLLELARQLGSSPAPVGVDILLVDAEDYGSTGDDASWALGTQYFADNLPYSPDNMPQYAVLLDMVGGAGAVFQRELFSQHYAAKVVNKVWGAARQAGYEARFSDSVGGGVVDDHIFLLKAGIPAIDIIEANHHDTGTFPPYWHTLSDDISNIDPATLKAVGQTMLQLIYTQQP